MSDVHFAVSEAAAELGVHPETIRRAIRTGELKAERHMLVVGGPYLISDLALREFESGRRRGYRARKE